MRSAQFAGAPGTTGGGWHWRVTGPRTVAPSAGENQPACNPVLHVAAGIVVVVVVVVVGAGRWVVAVVVVVVDVVVAVVVVVVPSIVADADTCVVGGEPPSPPS